MGQASENRFLRTRMAEQQRCRERWDCPRCSSRRRHLSGNLDSQLIPSRPFPSLASCEAWSGPRPRLPVPLVTGRPAVPRPARPLGLSRPKAGDVGSADVSQANAGMERLFHERATYQTTRLCRALGNAPIGPVPILPTACLASQRANPPETAVGPDRRAGKGDAREKRGPLTRLCVPLPCVLVPQRTPAASPPWLRVPAMLPAPPTRASCKDRSREPPASGRRP